MSNPAPSLLAHALLFGAVLAPVAAQFPAEVRYDLGQRLRRFENAWAATGERADPEQQGRRVAARQAMQAAVTSFFSMNPTRVAEQVDAAWIALLAGDDQDAAARLARFERARVGLSYDEPAPGSPWTEAARAGHLFSAAHRTSPTLDGLDDADRAGVRIAAWRARDAAGRLGPLQPADANAPATAAGADHELGLWLLDETGAPLHDLGRRTVSILDQPQRDALQRLRSREVDRGDGPLRLEAESLFGLQRLFDGLLAGEAYETDVPVCHLLDRARVLADHLDATTPLRLDDHPGEHWLRIPIGVRAAAVRLHVPARAADRETDAEDGPPPPLVLALHGMGGSEHLFFDGYGDGLAVRLAAARGWPFCAPRTLTAAGVGPLLDALATRLRFDPERVYVIGHSMGAGTAIGAVAKFPGRLGAVAALGGGGRIGDDDAARASRFLVLPGEFDFALGGARRLADELEDAGADCRYRVVPGVEHMLVVQEALPEVFAWLDEVEQRRD